MVKRGVRPNYIVDVPIERAGKYNLPPLNASVCYKYVTPECIRSTPCHSRAWSSGPLTWKQTAQYSIPKGTMASPGNELGIFESIGDHYSKASLEDSYCHNRRHPLTRAI